MKLKSIFIFQVVLLFFVYSSNLAQDIIKAQIGLKVISKVNNESSERAVLAVDRVKTQDNLQIFVFPERNSIIYLIHSDENNSSILCRDSLKKNALYIFPDKDSTYTVDGKSRKEAISIVIAPHIMKDVENLFKNGKIPIVEWKKLENKYLAEGSISDSETPEERISMAGNVRGSGQMDLKLYTGKVILVKNYSFDVKL